MSRIAVIAMLIALAGGCTSTSEPEAESNPKAECIGVDQADDLVGEVLLRINEARLAEGQPPLVLDPLLSAVADDFACEMIREGFLAHTNPNRGLSPGERLASAGYIYNAMAENLAAGQTSPEQVVSDWLASESHRANILAPEWREIGIAVRQGGRFGVYWVQEFADPVEFANR